MRMGAKNKDDLTSISAMEAGKASILDAKKEWFGEYDRDSLQQGKGIGDSMARIMWHFMKWL